MNLEIDMPVLPPFRPLYNLPAGTWLVICIGGRGGAKSYEVSRFVTLQATTRKKRIAVLRDEQSTIAQSILHEIKSRFAELNERSLGLMAAAYDMQDKGLKNLQSNTLQIFTKGFKTSTTGKKASLKSIADVDIAVIEEFEDITDEQKFNTFADSIRKAGSFIIINSNPPHKNHWFVQRYFNLVDTDHEGYYSLVPKNISGVVYIFTGYQDNPYLPDHIVAKYQAYGDPSSSMYNPDHYYSDILGLVSEGMRGRVYKNWEPVTDDFFESLSYTPYYGLDFGFSNDPAALVKIKSHNNRNFFKQMIYSTGLTNSDLAERMTLLGISKKDTIYADSAEPKSIRDLQLAGFRVIATEKGRDSLQYGITLVKGMENYYTEGSNDLKNEIDSYRYPLDEHGQPIPGADPVDATNHICDALRYAVTMQKKRNTVGKLYLPGEHSRSKTSSASDQDLIAKLSRFH